MKKTKEKIQNKTFELFSKYRGIIMGLATLSVIFFHFCEDKKVYKFGYDGFIELFSKIVGSSGVDIFLFVSGLGLYYSWKKNPNYKEFLWKRLPRILIPYLLIAIPGYIIRHNIIPGISIWKTISDFTFISLFVSGTRWHWYIFFIAAMYIIFPYLFDMVESCKKNIDVEKFLLNILTTITLLAVMLQLYAKPVFDNTNIMVLRIPQFIFGIYLGRLAYNKDKIEPKWIFIFFITIAAYFLRSYNKIILTRYIGALGAFLSICLTIQLFELCNKKGLQLNILKKILEVIGKYSLELYLTHVTIRTILLKCGIATYRIRYELLLIVLSVVASLIVHFITEKIVTFINKKRVAKASN